MKKFIVPLVLILLTFCFSMSAFTQQPTKEETENFIKTKLSYYLFKVFRDGKLDVMNVKYYYEFDSNCKLTLRTEYDKSKYNELTHYNIQEIIDVSDIQDVEVKSGMLTLTFNTKSKQNFNRETNKATLATQTTQNSFSNFHTFVFDQFIDGETTERLAKAFKHLSKLCGNKTNFDMFK